MTDSVRQSFEDTMRRYHGEIERLVCAAEQLCGKRKGIWCGNRVATCPFKLEAEPGDYFCTLEDFRMFVGDRVIQHDPTVPPCQCAGDCGCKKGAGE